MDTAAPEAPANTTTITSTSASTTTKKTRKPRWRNLPADERAAKVAARDERQAHESPEQKPPPPPRTRGKAANQQEKKQQQQQKKPKPGPSREERKRRARAAWKAKKGGVTVAKTEETVKKLAAGEGEGGVGAVVTAVTTITAPVPLHPKEAGEQGPGSAPGLTSAQGGKEAVAQEAGMNALSMSA
ncbi:hypothetical protein F4780DRAFT_777157 [Xylariomycetidae sp. FL0641]|nr:hypothetical protein F4780DRAFT_777157 [Xylariomycetidae sp. FL0641]